MNSNKKFFKYHIADTGKMVAPIGATQKSKFQIAAIQQLTSYIHIYTLHIYLHVNKHNIYLCFYCS